MFNHITELTPEKIEHFLGTYRDPHTGKLLGVAGRNGYRVEVKWLLTHVLELVISTSWQKVLKKEKPSVTKGKAVPEEEFHQFLSNVPFSLRCLAYWLIYECGFRPHELLSINLKGITFITEQMVEIILPVVNPKIPSGRNKTGG